MRPLALVLVLAIAGCASFEDSVVFHPASYADMPPTPGVVSVDVDLPLANDVKVHARWYPQDGAKGTILYCPGNAGNLEDRVAVVKQLRVFLGFNVLIFDYPGYGKSTGTPTEAGCYDAADAAYRWLTVEKKIAPTTLILYGESLGGAVAVDLATKAPHEVLVLNRTFTSIPDVADYQMPLLPNAMLMHNRFDTLSKIGKCPSPVFIANADKDTTVPLRQGTQLKAACTAPSMLFTMRGTGHNDPPTTEFYLKLRAFLADPANRGGAMKNVWPTIARGPMGPGLSAPAIAVSSPLAVPSPAVTPIAAAVPATSAGRNP
jgi:uncharacterized protein